MLNESVWITWENQTRNQSMSSRIGANLIKITTAQSGAIRYTLCILKTIPVLFRYRQKTVFAQNPSIVLCFLCILLKPLLRYRLIVDAHNAGIYPPPKLQTIANFIIRHANFVIVTNEALANQVTLIGGNPLILPDPIPEIIAPTTSINSLFPLKEPAVLFICSWASDEPYCEILSVTKHLPEVNFYITGKSKGKEKECNIDFGDNLILTGYVSDHDFHKLLQDSNIIVDLTTRENCLVCGAYEAISVQKPLILSDTQALRKYFGDFAFFVDNSADSILAAIRTILNDYEKASLHAQVNANKIERQWQSAFTLFKNKLST